MVRAPRVAWDSSHAGRKANARADARRRRKRVASRGVARRRARWQAGHDMAHSTCLRLVVNKDFPEPRKIQRAVETLERGGVIAYPTDTAYGIGCSIFDKKAIDRIYLLKGLKRDHLMSFVCPDLSDIARYALVENEAYRIMKRLLPGPYTFILRATPEVPRMLQSKRKTVGIRVPDHPVTLALARALRQAHHLDVDHGEQQDAVERRRDQPAHGPRPRSHPRRRPHRPAAVVGGGSHGPLPRRGARGRGRSELGRSLTRVP